MTATVVRPIEARDHEDWARLFAEYREFCGRPQDPAVIKQVWGWLGDSGHQIRGIVAEQGGRVAGIAHFRAFARTVDGNEGFHLDDLYIDAEFRGNGVARSLLESLGDIARTERAAFVRWVTAADNDGAQRLYDGIATRTEWVTYELDPTE